MKHNPVEILTVNPTFQEGIDFLRDGGRNVALAGATGRGKSFLLAEMPVGTVVSRRLLADDITPFMAGGEGKE